MKRLLLLLTLSACATAPPILGVPEPDYRVKAYRCGIRAQAWQRYCNRMGLIYPDQQWHCDAQVQFKLKVCDDMIVRAKQKGQM